MDRRQVLRFAEQKGHINVTVCADFPGVAICRYLANVLAIGFDCFDGFLDSFDAVGG